MKIKMLLMLMVTLWLALPAGAAAQVAVPEIVIEGNVVAVQGTTLQLLDGSVAVDIANAKIQSPTQNNLPITAIRPGARVTVREIVTTGTNQLSAGNLFVQTSDSVVLAGKIQRLNSSRGTVRVLRQKFSVTADTRIFIVTPTEMRPATLRDLDRTMPITVTGQTVNGKLVATQILQQQNSSGIDSVAGLVVAVNGPLLQLADGRVTVDVSEALLRSLEQTALPVTEIMPGAAITAVVKGFEKNGSRTIRIESATLRLATEGIIGGDLQEIDIFRRTVTVLNQVIPTTPQTEVLIATQGGLTRGRLEALVPNKRITVSIKIMGGQIVATRILQDIDDGRANGD